MKEINGDTFIQAFKKTFSSLVATNPQEILNYYTNPSRAKWTVFIKTKLSPPIAALLDLELEEKEFLRIDVLLSRRVNKYLVPFIWIESENDYQEAVEGETIKLLSVNGPVKVLITKDDTWSDSRIDRHDEQWVFALEDYKEQNRLQGDFVVIIFHKKPDASRLFYEIIKYDQHGEKHVMT